MDEQRQENNLSPQKNKQEEEQEIGKKLDEQTPRNNDEQVNERSKGYQFILTVVYGFNTVEQRKSLWLDGVPVTNNEINDFGDCVRDMGVNELQWTGNYYTWTNKQCGRDIISSRIDREFGNDEWMDKWGQVNVEYENPSISDHSSLMILLQKNQQHGKASLKIFNVWTEHEGFLEMVEAIWKKEYGHSIMNQLWCKLKDLQHEKELLIKLEKWSMIEKSALRQKSRIKWIHLVDANNKFFSSSIKERTQKKQIRSIMSLKGKMLYDPHEIQDEFVMFYKSLMGTSAGKLPAINAQVMKRGPTLTKQQRSGNLPKAFNCTLVSLIPKAQNPKTSIICDSQAGFVPGKKIADNIVLAHELVKAYARKNISPRSMLKIDLQKA
ncbi:uncharacterized protein [Solanum lycopersicum]|uniref:uncharacterized protein n=1 Tax=Solanum lycopersicum TaxID=4081 RepID=UPI003748EEC4